MRAAPRRKRENPLLENSASGRGGGTGDAGFAMGSPGAPQMALVTALLILVPVIIPLARRQPPLTPPVRQTVRTIVDMARP